MVELSEHKGKKWGERTVNIRVYSQNSPGSKSYNLTVRGITIEDTYDEIKWLFEALSRAVKIKIEEMK